MDTNENNEYELVPEVRAEDAATVEEPVQELPEEPVQEPAAQEDGAYHGTGAGRKESPYANSPYYTSREAAEQTGYIPNTQHSSAYRAPEPPKAAEPVKQPAPRAKKKWGKGILAAAVAVALVAGSCGITAWSVNEYWEEKFDRMEDRFEEELERLEDKVQSTGGSVSAGTSVSNPSGMTPSQVYAQNVEAVVAISNYQTASIGWGSAAGQVVASTGSGFVMSESGYVITNYHVVEGAEKLTVTLHSGEELEAELVGYDELNDVALLKVEAEDLDAVTMGSSDELLVGDMVVAIGNPLGELTSTMTVGYVSGKDRSVSTDGTVINMLQTDAAINSGNSGGPLFNMKGEVVGITTAKYSGSTGSGASIEGIGFAIPIDDVMGMVEDLMNYGYVKDQAYLGVEVLTMDSATAAMYNLPVGSHVQKVVEGGSADRAGVQVGDIIIAVGEYEVDSNITLQTVLRRFSAGETTTITVYRAGEEVVLDITFDERPQDLNSGSTQETQPGEMPDSGSYEEWYDYFFGDEGGQP